MKQDHSNSAFSATNRSSSKAQIRLLPAILLISAVLVGLGGLAIIATNPSLSASLEQRPSVDASISMSKTPEERIARGLRSAIIVETKDNEIRASRGSVLNITLQITHRPGNNPLPLVTAEGQGDGRVLYPPSVGSRTTPQQRMGAMGNIPGAIRIDTLLSFDPVSIDIKPGETKTVQMYVTIPKNFPDEMVNRSFNVAPGFRIPQNAYDDPFDVALFSVGITIHVVG